MSYDGIMDFFKHWLVEFKKTEGSEETRIKLEQLYRACKGYYGIIASVLQSQKQLKH
jgi:hypothetical protein